MIRRLSTKDEESKGGWANIPSISSMGSAVRALASSPLATAASTLRIGSVPSASSTDQPTFRQRSDYFEGESDMVVEVQENERYNVNSNQWGSQFLLNSDPLRYKSKKGQTDEFPTSLPIPRHLTFKGEWEIDPVEFSSDGWMYSSNFLELDLGHYSRKGPNTFVRRRRWIRRLEVLPKESRDGSDPIQFGSPSKANSPAPSKDLKETTNETAKTTVVSKSALPSLLSKQSSLPSTQLNKSSSMNTASPATTEKSSTEDFSEENFTIEYDDESRMETESISDNVSMAGDTLPEAQKRRGSFFSGFSGTTVASGAQSENKAPAVQVQTSSDPTLRVQSTTLSAIGKQIKFIESETKKDEELRMKSWKDLVRPVLESNIADLERRCVGLQAVMEAEANKGMAHIAKIEEDLNRTKDDLDSMKRNLYFPFCPLSFGQGGVYIGLTDFWLESAAGGFSVIVTPERQLPKVSLRLRGMQGSESSGVNARLQIEGFQLRGDKGKRVPKLSFSLLKFSLAFQLDMLLVYDCKTSKWILNPKDFQLSILSFKGPYGLNKSIVSLVISIVTPMIRTQLINNLPFELGLLIRTFPNPFVMRGDFELKGVELNLLTTDFHKSNTLSKMCDYSPLQMEMFYWMQKSIDRSSPMKNVADLVAYIRQFSRQKGAWEQLMQMWEQAANMYCEKVAIAKGESRCAPDSEGGYQYTVPEHTILFETFVTACTDLLQKRINVKFNLQSVDGQVSVNHIMSFVYQIVHRLAEESAQQASGAKRVRIENMIENLSKSYNSAMAALRLLVNNLDFAQLTVNVGMIGGPDGVATVALRDILSQAPMSLRLNILKDKNVGALPLVPYIISFKPQLNGDVYVEICYFSHDSSDVPSLMKDLKVSSVESFNHKPKPRLRTKSDNYSDHPEELTEAMLEEVRYEQRNAEVRYANYHNSITTGCYITSYNRVVTNITTGKVLPRAGLGTGLGSGTGIGIGIAGLESGVGSSGSANVAKPTDNAKLKEGLLGSAVKHLMVKTAEQQRRLEEILIDHPTGNNADVLLSAAVTNPHISMVVDRITTLQPGMELFTCLLGPATRDWKFNEPPPMEEEGRDALIAENLDAPVDADDDEGAPFSIDKEPEPTEPNCPVLIQSAPGIKLLTRIPKVDINVQMPSVIRFLLAHFADLQLLRSYLESLLGGDFYTEQLQFVKLLLEKLAKYLLLPVLSLDVNINGKIVSIDGELIVWVETPEHLSGAGRTESGGNAIQFEAQVSLRELIDDAIELDTAMKAALSLDSNS